MSFLRAAQPIFKKSNDGAMPKNEQLYQQCKAVLKGPEKGGTTPFSIGNFEVDRTVAKKIVAGVERRGEDYLRKNYSCLAETALQ